MSDSVNPHHDDNWTAAGVTGMFDSAQLKRTRRRHLWLTLIAVCVVATALLIPLNLAWQQVQISKLQTLTEQYLTQRHAIEDQPTVDNPTTRQALTEAEALHTKSRVASASDAVRLVKQALAKLNHAEETQQKIRQLRPLLNPLGETLSPVVDLDADDASPWLESSTQIADRRTVLLEDHKQIVTLLEEGDVSLAEQQLANLLKNLGQLQADNVLAMKTLTARQTWLAMQAKVPDRLKTHSALPAIQRAGTEAENGWDAGDWANAKLLYGGATVDLQQFLDAETTADEKADLLQNDAEAVARLEVEKADLRTQLKQAQTTKSGLADQLDRKERQRLQAEDAVTELQATVSQLTKSEAKAIADATTLRPVKQQLQDAENRLTTLSKQVATLTTTKSDLESRLQQTDRLLQVKSAEAEALRANGGRGGASTAIVQVSATLAAIESQLATTIGGDSKIDLTTSRTQLADALEQYDKAVQQRQAAIAAFESPTGRTVTAIDRVIEQGTGTLTRTLAVLDKPLAAQFDTLQSAIDAAQTEYDKQVPDQILPQHQTARTLMNRINALKQQQATYKPAHDRVAGKTTPDRDDLLGICRSEAQELLNERQRAEFAKLRASGKVPTAGDIEFVPIPAGTFQMGSNDGEDNEKPVHEVTISKPFFAGRYEVTVEQILKWLNSGASIDSDWIDFDGEYCPVRKSGNRYTLNTSSSFGTSAQQPMAEISWHGAVAYCQWLSEQDSRHTYRLPSEAEWEYMAKAGSTTAFPWGDSCNGTRANVDGNHPHGTTTKGPYQQVTVNVGSYAPNAFGLYDTVGNVYEWCNDGYDADYYGSSPSNDPPGPSGVSSRVCRGGSWYVNAIDTRCCYRNYGNPDDTPYYVGFRVVAE